MGDFDFRILDAIENARSASGTVPIGRKNGNLYTKDMTTLVAYALGKTDAA